jgi:hypothetical protein
MSNFWKVVIGTVVLAVIVANSKDVVRYIKISSM